MKSPELQTMNDLVEMVADVFDAKILRFFFVVGGHEMHVVMVEKTTILQEVSKRSRLLIEDDHE